MAYKPYMHVERLGEEATEGLLDNGIVHVTPKVDGTNAVCWNDDGVICAGNRKRKLSSSDDNAGFHAWMTRSKDDEAAKLRAMLAERPNLRVYGEWMGSSPAKFIGHIKDYDQSAHQHLYIFDVFDNEQLRWLDDTEWRPLLTEYGLDEWIIPVIATLDHPTLDDVLAIARKNDYLLASANHAGEGVVCRAPSWRNKYGHVVFGKLVLDEYKQTARKSKHAASGEVERDIVVMYVTDAELSKTKAKVCATCETDEFDTKSAKMVGMYISLTWKDLLAECPNWVKRFKTPLVDFALMKSLCDAKAREYIGL